MLINIENETPERIAQFVLQGALDCEYKALETKNKDNISAFASMYVEPETELIQGALDALCDEEYLENTFVNDDEEKVNTAYTILEKLKDSAMYNKGYKLNDSLKEFSYKGILNKIYLEILTDKDSLESHEYEIYKGESKEPYAIIQSLSPFKLIVNSTGQCNSTDVTFTQEHEFNKFDDLLEKLDYLIKENQNSSTHKINNIRILNSSLKLHDDYTAEDLMNKTFIEDLNVKIHNLALDTTLFYEKQLEDEICKPIKVEELFLLGNTEIIKNEEQEEKQHKKLHL